MANESLQRSRIYTDMRGVYLSGGGADSDQSHFALLENMYRDYDGDGGAVIESVPGFRRIATFPSPIRGIFSQKTSIGEFLLVHAGSALYRAPLPPDNDVAFTRILTVSDTPGESFSVGEDFFYLDGTDLSVVLPGGGASSVSDGTLRSPYVPTLYRDGAAWEQPNLLTDKFFETLTVIDPEDLTYGTPGLIFRPIADSDATCTVVGITPSGIVREQLYVPKYADIGGRRYRVVSVCDGALAGLPDTVSIRFAEGVASIGAGAFADCPRLTTLMLPDSLETIGAGAFAGCDKLYHVHLGSGIYSVGAGAFSDCPVGYLGYSGDSERYERISFESDDLSLISPRFLDPYTDRRLAFPVHSPASGILYGYVAGSSVAFTSERSGGLVTRVVFDLPDAKSVIGQELRILATLAPSGTAKREGSGFLHSHPEYVGRRSDLIRKCRVCRVFDGRVFVAGNPEYPNTVFYSEHPANGGEGGTYFGECNWFDDGVGSFPVLSLASAGGELIVLKAGDEGCGSIYYHTPLSVEAPPIRKIYPTSYVHSGVLPAGRATLFGDDPVFPSSLGLTCVVPSGINGKRKAQSRSRAVNEALLTVPPSSVKTAMFSSYLAVLAGDRIFLADPSRTQRSPSGEIGYEWYVITGVGTYTGDRRVYRYRSDPDPGCLLPDEPDGVVKETVYSETDPDDTVRTFVNAPGGRLSVYATEEWRGGVFHPAVTLGNAGGLCLFGTENGDLCVFNTDLRGVPPKRISDAPDFDPADYRRRMGRRIHPDFYDFAGHAPRYAVGWRSDNCGIPHLAKDTVPHSLTVKCRAAEGNCLTVEVSTERSGFSEVTKFPGGALSFDSLDFSSLSLENAPYLTLPIDEREKNWVEKQIVLYADRFRSPIAVASLAYRYRIRGRIKSQPTGL